jgi:hypothetical protein
MISDESKRQLDEIQLPTYDFVPPETFRTQWASKAIKENYAPRISKLSNDFCQAEILTVFNRERGGCITLVNKEDLLYDSKFSETLRDNRCSIHPLNYVGVTKKYSNELKPLHPGEDYQVRVFISNINGNPNLAMQDGLGKLLGYPDCCIKFFERYWSKMQYRDMIPCMEGIQYIEIGKNQYITDYYEFCNILIKGMGVRAVPHLPCSLKCHYTNAFAHTFVKYLPDDSYRLLLELLRLETSYSSYHGYAEVKNKLFKNVFNSIPFGEKLEFTLKQLMSLKTNNGFTDRDSESRAHGEIINFLSTSINGNSRILDLGCGDGSLLQKIGDLYPGVMLEGVEINKTVYDDYLKKHDIIAFNQDLNEFVFNGAYSLVMIANQRIQEMDEDENFKFFNNIRSSTKYLLIYDYNSGDIIFPLNFTRMKHSKGLAASMALYVPYKVN